MRNIPELQGFDHSIKFLTGPYSFISENCKKLQSDIFKTRINLKKTICLTGKEASEFFNSNIFKRHGAAPEPLRATLFGKRGVQTLDGADHLHRKKLFLSLMTPRSIESLERITKKIWEEKSRTWPPGIEIDLYSETQLVHTRAVCEWFGIHLEGKEIKKRKKELTAMFDQAAAKNLSHFKTRIERKRAEKWIMKKVGQIRATPEEYDSTSPLYIFSLYTDKNGKLLKKRDAAVEILNVLRPTVAVSLYVVFIAHALHSYPEKYNSREPELFIQEVRRLYPFFPAIVAKVQKDTFWKDYHFEKGTQVMLDLYGINHDERIWEKPFEFNPERFRSWDKSPFDFVPQGTGDHFLNHRCPGEWITIRLMKIALEFLTQKIKYTVPDQDLTIDFSRLPANVRNEFTIKYGAPL